MADRPVRLHGVDAPSFVGRQDALDQVIDAVGSGGALVLVEGEPGIGKTRLLQETLWSASVSERRILTVRCPPLREPFPLGPLTDGVRRLRDQLDVEVSNLGLSGLGGALRPVFPEWADQLPPALEQLDDPKETRYRLLRALTELVDRFGVHVLVLEDAHWADTATLEWMVSIVSAADGAMSTLVTFRPTDVPEGSLLLGLTSRPVPGARRVRVELEPLDVEQTREFVGSMLGIEHVSEEFARFLHEHTDGIPLAVEESIRLLRDRHDIVRPDGQWIRRVLDELEVPPTLRDSVLERIGRLPSPARQVLEAAAVLAAPADGALLAAVAELDEADGGLGVEAGLVSGLLREARRGHFEFRHALDAHAVAEAIPASRLRILHGRAAQALRSASPEPVVRLARHCQEAGDVEAWCEYSEASAELALGSGDDRTAVVTLLDVLTSVEHPIDRRMRLARKLADAWFFSAADLDEFADQVSDVLRRVLASGACTPSERGELRVLLGRALWGARHEVAALEEFEGAIPDLSHRPDLAIRAMVNLAVPLRPDWPAARHLQWLDRTARLVDQAGSELDQLILRGNRAMVLLLLGEEAGWEAADATVESGASQAERVVVAGVWMNAAKYSLLWGRYGDSRRRLDDVAELAEAARSQVHLRRLQEARARLHWYTGRWAGLDAVTAELMASGNGLDAPYLYARLLAGQLSLVAGARTAAEDHLQTVIDEADTHELVYPDYLAAPAALARLRLAVHAPGSALRLTCPVMETIARKGFWLWATDIAPVHVDALVAAGELAVADDVVEQFTAWLVGRHAPAPAAASVLCRAIVAEARGQVDAAASLFANAVEAWEALPHPYDAQLARERHGQCLLAGAGDPEVALGVLSDAERQLREMGATWDANRIAHVLRQHDVEVTRTWRGGPRGYGDDLSPRELDVVELAARGMTNKQIAEALFISPRTVGQHLSKAMHKLGASSRTALAMAAAQAGLISTDSSPMQDSAND